MDPITRHHFDNIANGMEIKNPDGSTSTVRTITIGADGKEYLIPTVWDGKVLEGGEAFRRAMEYTKETGIEWPSQPEGKVGRSKLEAFDQELHKYFVPTDANKAGQILRGDYAGDWRSEAAEQPAIPNSAEGEK
jgi:hypothetical protein